MVVGHGAVGATLAAHLVERGNAVRVVSRSGGKSSEQIQHVVADAGDGAALTKVCLGAAAVYNCVNPPYHRWARDWPPISEALLSAAEATGATLVTTGNLYPYGVPNDVMTEETPLAATDVKGRVRADMWREAQARHEAGRLRAVEVRAADYYGPGVRLQGHFGSRTMPSLLAGKSISLLGHVDAAHSFTFVPDVARALATVGERADMSGSAWHVPTAPAESQRAMADGLAGRPARIRRMPWSLLRVAGLVAPPLGEMAQLRHQFDRPYVMDSSLSEQAFGWTATPLADGRELTAAWWRAGAPAVAPSAGGRALVNG